MLTVTVADLSAKALKAGFFSKRGPTRSSKYNLRYWILTDTHLYYFTTSTVRFSLTTIDAFPLLHTCLLRRHGLAVSYSSALLIPNVEMMATIETLEAKFRGDMKKRSANLNCLVCLSYDVLISIPLNL